MQKILEPPTRKKKLFQKHQEQRTLRQQDWLPTANNTQGLPATQHCFLLLHQVETLGHVRGHHGYFEVEASRLTWQERESEQWHHRLDEGQDYPVCRQGTRLRREQQSKRGNKQVMNDTLGLPWAMHFHMTNILDSKGAEPALKKLIHKSPRLKKIFAHSNYRARN